MDCPSAAGQSTGHSLNFTLSLTKVFSCFFFFFLFFVFSINCISSEKSSETPRRCDDGQTGGLICEGPCCCCCCCCRCCVIVNLAGVSLLALLGRRLLGVLRVLRVLAVGGSRRVIAVIVVLLEVLILEVLILVGDY